MKSNWKAKFLSTMTAACLIFSAMPVFAAGAKNITIHFEDVTASDTDTLAGEAKVKVSVKGAAGNVSIVQTALDLDGDLKYKSVKYLKGSDNPDTGDLQVTSANSDKVTTGIISSKSGMDFGASEDLFIITFSGEPGKEGTLSLSDLKNTYFTIDGKDYFPKSSEKITIKSNEKANRGKTASIRLTMDKIVSFSGTAKPGITIKITSEQTDNYSIVTALDNAITSKGGHRDGKSAVPRFLVENTVLADDTYTVEVSAIGYVTYKKTGVTFDKLIEITNADFVPGDVNGDGKVDSHDKADVEAFIAEGEYSEAADFNRDRKVNSDDLEVVAKVSDQGDTDSKGDSAGGEAADGSGTADGGSGNGSGSSAGGSGNGNGTGGESGDGGGIPDGSGSENGSDIADGSGSENSDGTIDGTIDGGEDYAETFTDLGKHIWAKDSIYKLKNRGIISGISATEFAPANNIKRGDFILILTRMLSVNDEFTSNFADVPQGLYYYNAIGSAKAAGIAQGSGESFMPEKSITRQDLITLAYRAFLAKGYITQTDDFSSLDSFSDNGDISDYAKTAMASMVKAGIIQGSHGNVNPKGNATRAEVAVMCARMCDLMS